MNNIIDFIQEKLRLDKNIQVKKEYSDSEIDDLLTKNKSISAKLLTDLRYKTPQGEYSNLEKIRYYHKKGSKPERLVSSIKNQEKLLKRWEATMDDEWEEAAEVFKNEIIKRGYYTEEELFNYILKFKVKYNRDKYRKYLW